MFKHKSCMWPLQVYNLKKHEVETSNCYNSVDCSPRIDFITILKSGRCAEFIAVIILYCIALYCTAFLLQRPEWHQVIWLLISVGFCCVYCMCYMHCINCVVLYCTYFTVLYCISSSNVSTPVQNKHPHPLPMTAQPKLCLGCPLLTLLIGKLMRQWKLFSGWKLIHMWADPSSSVHYTCTHSVGNTKPVHIQL